MSTKEHKLNKPPINKKSVFELNAVMSPGLTDKRRFQLMNNNGKCPDGSRVTSQVLQMDCSPKKSKQIWKWRRNHICHKDGNCLVVDWAYSSF